MSSLVEIDHYDDATKGFGASLYIKFSHKAAYHDSRLEKAELTECPLKFTVCFFEKAVGSYNGKGMIRPFSRSTSGGSSKIFMC